MEVSPTRPWNGRASTKCLAFQLNKSGIRTGSLRTKLSVALKRNFQSRQRGRNGFEGGSSDYLLRRPNPALRARLAVHRDRPSNVSTWIYRKRPTLAALPVDVKAWTCPASEENCWPAPWRDCLSKSWKPNEKGNRERPGLTGVRDRLFSPARVFTDATPFRVAHRLTGIRWDELRTVTSVSRYFAFLCAARAGAGMEPLWLKQGRD
jgi:hypothetical protein